MPGFELLSMIVGLAMMTAAVVIVFTQRRRTHDEHPPVNLGLLPPERSHQPPPELTPGMVGPLHKDEADVRDLRLTLVDLATRGYLIITPLIDENDSTYEWVIRRTSRPLDGSIRTFEQTLLTLPFEADQRDPSPRTTITLSALLNAGSQSFWSALVAAMHEKGWVNSEGHHRSSSPWGWVGALLLVAGLLLTASMLIDWLATNDFRGVIGGLSTGVAGVLLASLGHRRTMHTDAAAEARSDADAFRDQIADLKAEDLSPTALPEIFNQVLPWALAFGSDRQFAGTVDEALRRSANWGRPVELDLAWYQIEGSPSARELTGSVSAMVNRHPAGGTPRQRPAPRRNRVAGWRHGTA